MLARSVARSQKNKKKVQKKISKYVKRTYDDNRSLPAGDSTSDVAKRLCAAAPLLFDAERVQGYIARGRVVEAPGGAAVSLVQPLVRPTKFGVGGRWEEHCGGWSTVGLIVGLNIFPSP